MRIAVILAGQWRTGLYCYPYLKEIFDDFEHVDYHIHTWAINNAKMLDPDFFGDCIWDMRPAEQTIDESDFNKIKEIYKPKTFEIGDDYENKRALQLTESTNSENEPGIASWYSAWKALNNMLMYENSLHEDNKYDLVIRIRPDIIIPKCELESFKHEIIRTFENPKLITSFYSFPTYDISIGEPANNDWENPDFFPIIDYYQIGSKKNIVNLHKWVYHRILDIDAKFNEYFWNIRDDFEVNDIAAHRPGGLPYPIIVRNLMADEDYISALFNKWSHQDRDIHSIMWKWYGLPEQEPRIRNELYQLDESVIHRGLHDVEINKGKLLEQTYKLMKQI
tara:strand:+ start:1485 stop:2492 length:1008 start_codon:yes stop_codon:yes gene_type:complete